jgi:hypothetical protein
VEESSKVGLLGFGEMYNAGSENNFASTMARKYLIKALRRQAPQAKEDSRGPSSVSS